MSKSLILIPILAIVLFGLSACDSSAEKPPSDLEEAQQDIQYLKERVRELEAQATRNAVAIRYIAPCIVEGYADIDYKRLNTSTLCDWRNMLPYY